MLASHLIADFIDIVLIFAGTKSSENFKSAKIC